MGLFDGIRKKTRSTIICKNLDEYQVLARKTAVYPKKCGDFYSFLGLPGEVGELLNRVKKVHRDREGEYNDEDLIYIKKELGDILWYLSDIATMFELNMSDIAQCNLDKLLLRSQTNTIKGDSRGEE